MSQLILNRGESFQKNLFNKVLRNFHLGPYFLVSSLVLFVSLVTVVTLMFSTRQVTKGYVLDKLETEHQDLIKKSEASNMRISQAKSLSNIQNSPRVRRMSKPNTLVYVQTQTELASR
jgi:hypothetical protein